MEINEYVLQFLQMGKEYDELNIFQTGDLLSKTEFRLLREVILEQEKGKRIISSELARRLGITRSAVSQIVTKLEKRGIVQRVDSPIDRKIAFVELSAKAREVFEQQSSTANEFADRVVERFGVDRTKAFLEEYADLVKIFREVHAEYTGQGEQKEEK